MGHAVVIGASVVGLTAAAAPAGHAERVTVVDRDVLPDGPEARKGTPQARHADTAPARRTRLPPAAQVGGRLPGGLQQPLLPHPADFQGDWRCISIGNEPLKTTRGGALIQVDGGPARVRV
jgi:glycine/D-amino acid oxidase-like deaminating enzyme